MSWGTRVIGGVSRSLSLAVLITGLVPTALRAQFATGYSAYELRLRFPIQSGPASPTEMSQCTDLQSSLQAMLNRITAEHESCLKAAKDEHQIPGMSCSKPSCQALHDYRDAFRKDMDNLLNDCRTDVWEHQEELREQQRREAEAERKRRDFEERQKRDADAGTRPRARSPGDQTGGNKTDRPEKSIDQIMAEWRAERRGQLQQELAEGAQKQAKLRANSIEKAGALNQTVVQGSQQALDNANRQVQGVQNSASATGGPPSIADQLSAFNLPAASVPDPGYALPPAAAPPPSDLIGETANAFFAQGEGAADRNRLMGANVAPARDGVAWGRIDPAVLDAAADLAEKAAGVVYRDLTAATDEVNDRIIAPLHDYHTFTEGGATVGEEIAAGGRLISQAAPNERSREDVEDITRNAGELTDVTIELFDKFARGEDLTADDLARIDRAAKNYAIDVVDRIPIIGKVVKQTRETFRSAEETANQLITLGTAAFSSMQSAANTQMTNAYAWAHQQWSDLFSAVPATPAEP